MAEKTDGFGCPVIQQLSGRHIDDLAAQAGNVLANVFGTGRAAKRLGFTRCGVAQLNMERLK